MHYVTYLTAVDIDSLDLVKKLVEKGVDINAQNFRGETPLYDGKSYYVFVMLHECKH